MKTKLNFFQSYGHSSYVNCEIFSFSIYFKIYIKEYAILEVLSHKSFNDSPYQKKKTFPDKQILRQRNFREKLRRLGFKISPSYLRRLSRRSLGDEQVTVEGD